MAGFVNLLSEMQRLLADWLILYPYIPVNKKDASSAEKDKENNIENVSAADENRHHSDLFCKSERATWQKVPKRSQHSRAQREGIINPP